MTFPANFTRIWVRGRFVDLDKLANGDAEYGTTSPARFTPSPSVLLNAGTRQIISTDEFSVTPSPVNGYFQIQLPATDDPDINPTGWTYAVVDPAGRQYNIVVPIDTPALVEPEGDLDGEQVIDLVNIVPGDEANPGTVQLITGQTGAQGPPGEASDHAGLDNLLVDSHTQYLTEARGDARYYTETETDTLLADKEDSGTAAAAVAAHVADSDPHPGYVSSSEAAAAYQPIDSDLTTIAGLTPANGDVIQRVSGVWANRTVAQVKTDLGLATVATSGAYADLSGAPAIPDEYTDEQVRDVVSATLVAGTNITITPDDGADTVTISAAGGGSSDHGTLTGLSDDDHTQYLTEARGDARYYTETETDTLLADKADEADLTAHTGDTANPHSVTKTQVGLGSVDNVSATDLRDRTTHTGTQSADTLTDGTTNKAFLATEQTKLAGIATGATANSPDATLLARANHTGSQAQSTVTDLTTDLAGKQPLDSDLTAIAALSPADDTLMQRKSGAWTARTPAQVKTDLVLTKTDVGLGSVTDTAQVALSLADAKGDLLVATAADTVARLAVGANSTVLVADSSQTSGLRWAAVVVEPPFDLTDGASVALNAALGKVFRLTAAGNRTISVPTNPTDGQVIVIEHTASGANRTLTLTTGSSGAFIYGTDVTAPLAATTSGTTDIITAMYRTSVARWRVMSVAAGY